MLSDRLRDLDGATPPPALVSSLTRFAGKFSKPGSTALRYSLAGTCCLRHVSTVEMMAATRGPACSLPTWIQFLRPMATGRIEFSVALLLSSSSGWSRKRLSRFHSLSVYSHALVLTLWGKPSLRAVSILTFIRSRIGMS
jgi:hypothetical protein